MILGDSLQVMASLAEREGLRGKVQCIYLDPPYGIKFNSNFQWSTTSRDVKDGKADHITREPEQVKAFRDTWRDGIHSYLTYLRDRLTVARDLLTDSGSIFVQIGDENVHRVRAVMDEVFGEENCCGQITVMKTAGQSSELIAGTADFLLWFSKQRASVKFRNPLLGKGFEADKSGVYKWVRERDGSVRPLTEEERALGQTANVFALDNLSSQRPPGDFPVRFSGRSFGPGKGYWKTGELGMSRLIKANRIGQATNSLRYVRFLDDFRAQAIGNIWSDTGTGSFTDEKWPPTPATSCSTQPAVPAPPLPSPNNGAAAGSRLTPRAWRWRWPAPASWARVIPFTCWPILARASSRKPKSRAPRRVRSRCRGTSATASSMSACRTSRSSPSPTTRRSMSSGSSGRRSWSRCARS
jgi:hypothetical protein